MGDNDQFGDVQVFTGQESVAMAPAVTGQGGSIMAVEQSRAVAEVQGAIVVAKSCPRDEQAAYLNIMKSCKRKSLAECAMYAYRRGGTLVEGPSIRLAETLARCFGNMTYGFREIGRGKDYSEVEAFAHDLETNTRATRTFQVKHWRDTKQGGKELTAERDKYEMVAGMAQRRVRSCILEIIPGDIVEAATEACKKTIASDEKPIDQRVNEMLVAYYELGVTKEMIEAFLQRSLRSVVPQDLIRLTQMYRSLRDGVASRDELFPPVAVNKQTGEITTKKEAEKPAPEKPTTTATTEPPGKDEKTKPKHSENVMRFINLRKPGLSQFVIENHDEIINWGPEDMQELRDKFVNLLGLGAWPISLDGVQMTPETVYDPPTHPTDDNAEYPNVMVTDPVDDEPKRVACPDRDGAMMFTAYCEEDCVKREGCPSHTAS